MRVCRSFHQLYPAKNNFGKQKIKSPDSFENKESGILSACFRNFSIAKKHTDEAQEGQRRFFCFSAMPFVILTGKST